MPIIAKPTPVVIGGLYDATLRPSVDRISAATKYGVDSYQNARDFSAAKVKTFSLKPILHLLILLNVSVLFL